MALRHVKTRQGIALAGVLGITLTLAACGGDSEGTADAPPGADGGDECAAFEQYGDLKGKSISIYTSIVSPQDQAQIDSYKPFEACTGATVKYEGSKDFEKQLPIRIKAGAAPDIAFIPQPGLLATLVRTTKAVKPAPKGTADNVEKYYSEDWKNYGTVDGVLYAAPLGADVKSYVWYSPKKFTEKGYTVPKTWDEMIALSDKIAADDPKAKPWCVGFGSGEATGWVGTDWMEDVLLRSAGPEVYDQWVKHEIPFNAPQVADALQRVGQIIKNPKYVNGGLGDVKSIATTQFQDAGQPILDGTCYMHRQASFYAVQYPEGTKIAEDGDVFAFYLPAIDPSKGSPVLGSGDFTVSFRSAPEVEAFQTYLSSPEWANAKAKVSTGWASANNGLDVANLKSPVDQLTAKTLADPKAVFRFDGSDQMPASVGAGSFWKGMTDWITGQSDADTLDAIEGSWPKS